MSDEKNATVSQVPMKQIPIVAPANNQEPTPIFKLTVDCCDEIFDYLSLVDLHSFGQTCKAMQNVSGEYFKQNYAYAENVLEDDGTYIVGDEVGVAPYQPSYAPPDDDEVHISTTNFVPFITYISKYWDYHGSLEYIESHANKFTSVNHLYMVGFNFEQHRAEIVQNILGKVETVQLRICQGYGDLYEQLLKFCGKVKRLYIQRSDLGEFERDPDLNYTDRNRWLQRNYSTLEHLEIIPEHSLELRELSEFFQYNPNVRSFSSSIQCIWANRNALLKSDIQLDTLEVKIFDYYFRNTDNTTFHFEEIVAQLRQFFDELFARGSYKRLFLYLSDVDKQTSKFVVTLKGLEKLCIREIDQIFDLPQLINLKELAIFDGVKTADMEILADSYTNLQRLHICNASIDDILPFIHRSPTLNKIKVFAKDAAHFNDGILSLKRLNEDRGKLLGARKVTVFVPDNIFLKTKWATENGNINLNLIELKRVDSIEWNHHF